MIIFLLLFCFNLYGSVEHKREFIDIYLKHISNNMDEKTQLLEHIQKYPSGTYLDVGTGGDAIAEILSQLPLNIRPTLIAADIDPLVLQAITKRKPFVAPYINSLQGPKVELLPMSATDMKQIKDSTLAGIGASALTHEVFSYVSNMGPLDQFVAEICRVLEKEGVFIYRDPKWVDDPLTRCTMILKNNHTKYYASLFLSKFLDREFSLLRDYRNECCKPKLYSKSDVKINLYFQNSKLSKQIGFDEFLHTPSHMIDFTKNFSIEAPKGLMAEIQRHYLMYLIDYYAPGFLDECQFKGDINLNDLSKNERDVLLNFVYRKAIPLNNNIIEKSNLPLLLRESEILRDIFTNGVKINISGRKDLLQVIKSLNMDGIDRNLMYLIDNEVLLIDPKYLALLFHDKNKGIFNFLNPEDELPFDLLEHLKLEGEEHYFYKTTDELITYMGQFSQFILKDTHKQHYVLAPIDLEHIKEAPRNFYKSVLKREMLVMDLLGNMQEPVVEKNIIHFQLMPEKRAFENYDKIIEEQGEKYPVLRKWVEEVEKRERSI